MLAEGKRHREKTGKSLMVPRYDIVPIPEHLRGHLAQNSILEFTAETAQSMYDFRADDVIGKAAGRPILLLHSSVDSVTPTEQSIEMFKRAGQPCDLHLFAETDHFMFAESNTRVRSVIYDWLEQVLPGPGAGGRGVDPHGRGSAVIPSRRCSRSRATRLLACGVPDADAAIAAKQMIEADLTGFDAHGIFRLAPLLQDAEVRPRQGQGQHQGAAALGRDRAGRRRRRHRPSGDDLRRPISRSSWRGSPASAGSACATPITPAPPASIRRWPVAHGMVGIYAAVSTVNHMAPWGGAEALIGTNPIAIAIPAGKEAPVVLDIATSVSSFGNIRQHHGHAASRCRKAGWCTARPASRSPIRRRSARACCCRSAATRAAGLR